MCVWLMLDAKIVLSCIELEYNVCRLHMYMHNVVVSDGIFIFFRRLNLHI